MIEKTSCKNPIILASYAFTGKVIPSGTPLKTE
jgi:hypothetical protein